MASSNWNAVFYERINCFYIITVYYFIFFFFTLVISTVSYYIIVLVLWFLNIIIALHTVIWPQTFLYDVWVVFM